MHEPPAHLSVTSPTSPTAMASPLFELTTLLEHPPFLPTHHESQPGSPSTPAGPHAPLPGLYALWLVPKKSEALEGLLARAAPPGGPFERFPEPHVALTPWMSVENSEEGGEADLLWKTEKIISEWNRGTHMHRLKLHFDESAPLKPADLHPTKPTLLHIPLRPAPSLLSLSLIARQITVSASILPHENPRVGLAVAFCGTNPGPGSLPADAGEGAEVPPLEVDGVEVWWTGGKGKEREWKRVGKVPFA